MADEGIPVSPPHAPTSPAAPSRILKQTILNLKDQNSGLSNELTALKSDLRRCSAEKLAEIKKRLATKATVQRMEQELKAMRSELDDQRAATLASNHQLRKAEGRAWELAEEVRQLTTTNLELERRSEETGATLGIIADERKGLRQRERELKDTIRALQMARLDAEKEKETAVLQLQRAHEERKQAQSRAAHYETRYKEYKGAAGVVATRSDTLDKQLDDLNGRTLELQASLKLAKNRAANADGRARELKERVSALEQQLAQSEQHREQLADQIQRLQADSPMLARVEARLKKSERLVKALTQVDATVAEERERAVARRDRLLELGIDASPGSGIDQLLQELENQLAALRHANRVLLRGREEAVAVTDRLQRESTEHNQRNAALMERLQTLEAELRNLAHQCEDKEQAARVAQQQANELRGDLAQAMESLEGTGGVIRELQAALQEMECERQCMRGELEALRGHTHRVTLENHQQRLELQLESDAKGICAQESANRCHILEEECFEWLQETAEWHEETRRLLQKRHQHEQRGEKQRALLLSAEYTARMRLEGDWAESLRALRVAEVEGRMKRQEIARARDAAEKRILRSPMKPGASRGRTPTATAKPKSEPKPEVRRSRFAEAEATRRDEEVIMLDTHFAEEVILQQEPSVRAVLMAEERGARLLLLDQSAKEASFIRVTLDEQAARSEFIHAALHYLRRVSQEWRRRYDLELGEVVARAIVCGEEKAARRALRTLESTLQLRAQRTALLCDEEDAEREQLEVTEDEDRQAIELVWNVWCAEVLEAEEAREREDMELDFAEQFDLLIEEVDERLVILEEEHLAHESHLHDLRSGLYAWLDDAEQHRRWLMEHCEAELRASISSAFLVGTVGVDEERWRNSISTHEGLQWRQLILEERQAVRSLTSRFHSRMSSLLPSGVGLAERTSETRFALQSCYDGLRLHQLEAEEASARARLVNESAYHRLVDLRRVRSVGCVPWATVLAALQAHEDIHRNLVAQMEVEELLCLLSSLAPHKQVFTRSTGEAVVEGFERIIGLDPLSALRP